MDIFFFRWIDTAQKSCMQWWTSSQRRRKTIKYFFFTIRKPILRNIIFKKKIRYIIDMLKSCSGCYYLLVDKYLLIKGRESIAIFLNKKDRSQCNAFARINVFLYHTTTLRIEDKWCIIVKEAFLNGMNWNECT